MRISIIGTGNVGGALGTGWARAGNEVIFGTRDPKAADAAEMVSGLKNAKVMSVADSVTAADVVALAVPWSAVPAALGPLAAALAGKILIDCTNPTTQWPKMDHALGSGGEQVARLAPKARVVKCFNTTGAGNMRNPKYGSEAVTMFYAGDDAAAKKLVHGLAGDLGFDPVDAGGLDQSFTLEIVASLWGTLSYTQKMGMNIAFRLMRRTD